MHIIILARKVASYGMIAVFRLWGLVRGDSEDQTVILAHVMQFNSLAVCYEELCFQREPAMCKHGTVKKTLASCSLFKKYLFLVQRLICKLLCC